MELSRTEYPTIASTVEPSTAAKLLRDRIHKGQILNTEVAEWLQERRRAEENYTQALMKLAKRPPPGESPDLGVFHGAWSRIVNSTSALASSHEQYAQKLESEVERPIREFCTHSQDWSGMKTVELNLNSMAKTFELANERSEKLRKRGQKAKPQQVAEAAAAAANAMAEWSSQAPFIFEKLQVADEARCNNLRDTFTRWQTLEVDEAQAIMQSAEATLSVILDVSTEEEIRSFADRATGGKRRTERSNSHSHAPASALGQTAAPSIMADDSVSVQSAGSGGGGAFGGAHGLGLRRLGTVLRNRNRNSIFHRSSSPDRRTRTDGSRNVPPIPSSPNPPSTAESQRPASSHLEIPADSALDTPLASESAQASQIGPPTMNGAHTEFKSQPSESATSSEPRLDSEGYSIPPPSQEIGQFQEEEAEEHQPQFKLEIKNDVIHEEEDEADAAMSKVANTLRAQNTVSRKIRGRRDARDVRNTMFIPNPPPDLVESIAASSGSPTLTPMKNVPRPSTVTSEAGSDTQSIRSSRSVTSFATATIKHPELTDPGLHASLIESISMSFDNGKPAKALVTGEIALAFNASDSPEAPGTDWIRLDNFSVLEKVAPNPAFISSLTDRAGEYSLLLPHIHKTAVAFKYQVHVDEGNFSEFAPLIVSPVWRAEAHQTSVIVHWRPNSMFRQRGLTAPYVMRNVVFITGVEGAYSPSCQSKPAGSYSKEKGRLVWKIGDITVDPDQGEESGGKMLARFTTESLARPTQVEIRWEIIDDEATIHGSGLALSVRKEAVVEEADPFADSTGDERSQANTESWVSVGMMRKVVSGKYLAA